MSYCHYLDEKKNVENLVLFVLFLIVYVVIYGVFMSTREFGMHQDELFDYGGCRVATELYFANGRWAQALFSFIYPGLPPLNGAFITGVCLSVALIIQTNILKLSDFFSKIIYGVIYMCVPILSEHLIYANQGDTIGIAILINTLGISYSFKRNLFSRILAIVLIVTSVGFYQSLIVNAAVLIVGLLVLESVRRKKALRVSVFAPVYVVIFISVVLYLLSAYISRNIPFVSTSVVEAVERYRTTSAFRLFQFFDDCDSLLLWVKVNSIALVRLLTGGGITLLCRFVSLFTVLIIVELCCKSSYNFFVRQKIMISFLLLCMLAMPYSIWFLTEAEFSSPLSMRTYTALPIACAVVCVCLFEMEIEFLRRFKVCVIGFLSFFVLFASYHCVKVEKSLFSSWIKDFILIEHYAKQLSADEGVNSVSPRIIVFGVENAVVGLYRYKESITHPYIRHLRVPSERDSARYRVELESMPYWPASESIKYVGDDTVIVKYR